LRFTVKEFDSLNSTNSYAIELIKQKADKNGMIIHSFCQTDGKGQRNSTWESLPYQNLTFSIIYHPKQLLLNQQFLLSAAISLGIVNCLKNIGLLNVYIKWPNDIVVNNKKIAGILIESTAQKNYVNKVVIGIGLNLNQTQFTYPQATSVILESGVSQGIQAMRDELLLKLDEQFTKLENDEQFECLLKDYKAQLWGGGLWISARFAPEFGSPENIKIIGVEPSGELLICMANGSTKKIQPKEIKYLY
jgi:BirA family biotin operon repressor/biotin-[acetyl-CoA-carboxylase] ligase